MSLDLCIDPIDCEFPGLVNEIITDSSHNPEQTKVLAASLTIDGFAYLLHNKSLFVWNFVNVGKGQLPHAYKLVLPSTGLNYTLNLITLKVRDGQSLPSVLAISPMGFLRYWPTVGGRHRDKEINLKDEVVLSVVPCGEEDHVNRFLVSTTTGSFYQVDIFKELFLQESSSVESIMVRPLALNTVSMSRRVTSVLFGSSTDKNILVKVVITKDFYPNNEVDMVAIYQTSISFCSMKRVNVASSVATNDFILQELLSQDSSNQANAIDRNNPAIQVVDAIPYKKGLLLLMAIFKHSNKITWFSLVHISQSSVQRKTVNFMKSIILPSDLAVGVIGQNLPKIVIYALAPSNFILIFPTFLVSLENAESENCRYDITKFNEQMMGSASINQFCQVIMKKSGICNIRHLPRGFDTTFWQKFGPSLQTHNAELSPLAHAIRKVFSLFASKNLPDARAECAKLLKSVSDNEAFAETIITKTKAMLDRVPWNDARWLKDPASRGIDSQIHRSSLINSQIEDKISYYKMIIMFLRYFGMLDRLNHPCKTFDNRSSLSVLAEFGEKLYAMSLIHAMLGELNLATVDEAVRQLAQTIQAENDMMDNTQLSPRDYFAKEVTSVEALIPAVMRAQQKELETKGHQKGALFVEIGSLFNVIIQACTVYQKEDWAVRINSDDPMWTKNPQIMYHFTREFDLIFDVLEKDHIPEKTKERLFSILRVIARFCLSQQSRLQRNRSSIIQRFYNYGQVDVALRLAEEYLDFATLINHSCEKLPEAERRYQLEKYKVQFKNEDFDLFLYEYYKEHNLITDLLEQQGDRLEHFLAKHDEINWIRNVEKQEYGKAKETLRSVAYSTLRADKKKTILSLAMLAALCDDDLDQDEISQIKNNIILIEHQEAINPEVAKQINPGNAPMSIEEIVNANISEQSTAGFLKALFALTAVIDTRESSTEIGTHTIEKLRNRVWTSMVGADSWQAAFEGLESLPNNQANERVTEFLSSTVFAEVMDSLLQSDIAKELKCKLLPESTHGIKAVFPLKDNLEACQIFYNFLDDGMDTLRQSCEKPRTVAMEVE